ncbi:MAG: hypothetical protein GF421_05355, partial [Candidatus Aminicenantes bacterium]|nr:hypothetical protein [Candidatus Aminicenantes bacterium]
MSKKTWVLFITIGFLCLNPVFSHGAETILIKNGTIVPVEGNPMADSDILIKEGKIIKIGPDLKTSSSTRVIDASGKFVYPGMVALMTA